jgi:hypothetical protein
MQSESTRLVKVTMLFPLIDNDGNPFDEPTWDWFTDRVTEVIGDFTEMGLTGGQWRGYSDRSRWIMAVIPDGKLDGVYSFLREARVKFKQEAMYLDFHPVELRIIK